MANRKWRNNDLQNTTQKINNEQDLKILRVNTGDPEG